MHKNNFLLARAFLSQLVMRCSISELLSSIKICYYSNWGKIEWSFIIIWSISIYKRNFFFKVTVFIIKLLQDLPCSELCIIIQQIISEPFEDASVTLVITLQRKHHHKMPCWDLKDECMLSWNELDTGIQGAHLFPLYWKQKNATCNKMMLFDKLPIFHNGYYNFPINLPNHCFTKCQEK